MSARPTDWDDAKLISTALAQGQPEIARVLAQRLLDAGERERESVDSIRQLVALLWRERG